MAVSFEAAMIDDTMLDNQPDDMEMALDAGKFAPHEDIDIDIDYTDHAPQDEMMTEDNIDSNYDLDLEDAVGAAVQDEEMTDDSNEDELVDEDITDAPFEITGQTMQSTPEDTEASKQAVSTLSGITSDSNHQLQPHSQEQEADGTIEVSVVQPDTEASTIATVLPPAATQIEVGLDKSAPQLLASSKKDVVQEEELITWESDEEDEPEDETADDTAKVGNERESSASTARADGASEGLVISNVAQDHHDIKDTQAVVPSTDEAEPISQALLAKEAAHTQESIKNHETLPSQGDDQRETPVSGDVVAGADIDVQEQVAEDETDNQEHHDLTQTITEILHPIVVHYGEDEMSLFPPVEDEEHNMFFLSDKKLAFDNCEALFKAFRAVLGQNISDGERLVLGCPDLGLEIHEGIPEASTLTIVQLLHLHIGLSQNDGHNEASALVLVLKHQHDVSARLNHLYALLSDGKGISALHDSSDVQHNAYNEKEYTAVEHENDGNEAADREQDALSEEAAANGSVNGFATPKHKDLNDEDGTELDFRSPTAVLKHNGTTLDENHAVAIEEVVQRQLSSHERDHASHEEDIITYDDDDDDDDNKEEVDEIELTANNPLAENQKEADPDANTDSYSDDEPAVINHEANSKPVLPDDTNTAKEQPGSEPQDTGALSPEEKIDTNGLDEIDNIPPGTLSGDITSGMNDGDTTPGTSVSAKPTLPAVSCDYDEIDYSDDESISASVPTTKATAASTLHSTTITNSPKRPAAEEAPSNRDLKKVRSS